MLSVVFQNLNWLVGAEDGITSTARQNLISSNRDIFEADGLSLLLNLRYLHMLQHVGSRGLLVARNALILGRLLVLVKILVDGRCDLVERNFGRILLRLSFILSGAARDQGTVELD